MHGASRPQASSLQLAGRRRYLPKSMRPIPSGRSKGTPATPTLPGGERRGQSSTSADRPRGTEPLGAPSSLACGGKPRLPSLLTAETFLHVQKASHNNAQPGRLPAPRLALSGSSGLHTAWASGRHPTGVVKRACWRQAGQSVSGSRRPGQHLLRRRRPCTHTAGLSRAVAST